MDCWIDDGEKLELLADVSPVHTSYHLWRRPFGRKIVERPIAKIVLAPSFRLLIEIKITPRPGVTNSTNQINSEKV